MDAVAKGELRRLNAAVQKFAEHLSQLDVGVFAPLYANTFPLASVARIACNAYNSRTTSIESFDWNWSTQGDTPPFQSSRPYQLFFATESEFSRIHDAGISFFAVPASVFHPRYIFLGLPHGAKTDDPKYADLEAKIVAAFSTALPRRGRAKRALRQTSMTWVSDIPGQAEMLAEAVERCLGAAVRDPSEPIVQFWQHRRLEDSLGIGTTPEGLTAVKAFIWGGPLATVAQQDARPRRTKTAREKYGQLRLRDPSRLSRCIALPSLADAFTKADINWQHALYCCVGYKESRLLKDYYAAGHHIGDTPWSLIGRKLAYMDDGHIPALLEEIAELFSALFSASKAMLNVSTERTKWPKIFTTFKDDYDKYCRTRNPIAQLYTAKDYVTCLADHHDQKAFDALFL